jgi:catechol 2,3-dioxygenase-like lactoylglutathione lyase family enzyme
VFDHVGSAVADLAASERFYRTVLSVLGAEPRHADAELVEWDDWDIGATDREHPVSRGLHVGFRPPSPEAVDAFWQAATDAGCRHDGRAGPRTIYGPDNYGGSCSTRTATAQRRYARRARAPFPTAASTTFGPVSATRCQSEPRR